MLETIHMSHPRYGDVEVFTPSGMERVLSEGRYYEDRHLQWLVKHAGDLSGLIVDVGAHVGLLSRALAIEYPECSLVCFEPHPTSFRVLVRNVPDAVLHRAALFNQTATLSCVDLAGDGGGVRLYRKGRTYEVSAHRLDDYRFTDVALIKIDTEGMEHYVIDGARETIRQCRPVVYWEHNKHLLIDGYDSGVRSIEALLLKKMNYRSVLALSKYRLALP